MIKWLGKALDSVMFQVSPERGNRRATARFRREYADTVRERLRSRGLSGGGFQSAEKSRDAASWLTSKLSPDSALEEDREDMNERTDSAVKNYELGTAHVEGRVVRVVGCGMAVDPDIQPVDGQVTDEQADRWNRDLRTNWERTTEQIGRHGESLMELQQLCQRYLERRGEWFVLIGDKPNPLAPTTLKAQVIDPDRVETPPGKEGDKNVRMGIKTNDAGDILGYYVRESQPGDTLDVREKHVFYPAKFSNGLPRVIHHFAKWWEKQRRGFPLMQVGTKRLKNAEEYADAEVERNYVASCHAAFVRTDLGIEDAMESQGAVEDADGNRVREISPAMIQYLGLSDSVEFSDPSGAPTSFPAFMEYEGRMFAAGANTSYEVLTGDWKGITYSAGRIIWNIEEAITKVSQEGHKRTLRWLYRHFVSRAVTGVDAIIDAGQAAYRNSPWTYWAARIIPPAKASIDPPREDRNDLVNAEARLLPFSDLVEKKNGQPADKVYERIARDLKARKDAGLEIHAPNMGRDGNDKGSNDSPTQVGDTNTASSEANS